MSRRLLFALAPLTAAAAFAASGSASHLGCQARWTDTELVIGNAHVERKWTIRDGLLEAVSFVDREGPTEWIAKPAGRPAPLPPGKLAAEKREITVNVLKGKRSPVEAESLVVELIAKGKITLHYRFQIFPEARGVKMQFRYDGVDAAPVAAAQTAEASGVETARRKEADDTADALEDLLIAGHHLRFTQVTLVDQTDIRNELVFEKEWLLATNEATLELQGNIFVIEDTLSGNGLIFLKQAPLPHARPVKSAWDVQANGSRKRFRFGGQGYPFVLLAYRGGTFGRRQAFQRYQRQLRVYEPTRDGMFLSNTWGDRSRDARLNEPFMLQEVAAGAKMGVDVIQIDDGWQKGRTANSARGKGVWNGYWAADPQFWIPDAQRFPQGLAPIVKAARDKGMKFGLWFGPDSSNDVANWERDAARLLELHRTDGIDYFKIDSVKAFTTLSETNLHRFFNRVLDETNGKVVFDLDVTAETRPGYFGVPGVGPVFVENRYTDFHRYWPHLTLRNLWKLAQWVDPVRLRMEFLNNTRNTKQYEGDPLAPSKYSPDYLFATAMYGSPLGWFEISNLPPDYIERVAKLVKVWKQNRAEMFGGVIHPVGDAPDGTSWTGLLSAGSKGHPSFLLLFRELNQRPEYSLALPVAGKVTVLAGQGSAKMTGNTLHARIPAAQNYLWVRID